MPWPIWPPAGPSSATGAGVTITGGLSRTPDQEGLGRWWCRPITSLRSSQSLHGIYRVCGVSLFANSSELNAGFIGPRRRRAGKPRAFLIRRGRRSNVPYSVPPDERECAPPCGSAAIWSAGRRPREDCTAIGLSRADSLRLMF